MVETASLSNHIPVQHACASSTLPTCVQVTTCHASSAELSVASRAILSQPHTLCCLQTPLEAAIMSDNMPELRSLLSAGAWGDARRAVRQPQPSYLR